VCPRLAAQQIDRTEQPLPPLRGLGWRAPLPNRLSPPAGEGRRGMNTYFRALLLPSLLVAFLSTPVLLAAAGLFAALLLALRFKGRALLMVLGAAALVWAAPHTFNVESEGVLHVTGLFLAALSLTLPLGAWLEGKLTPRTAEQHQVATA